MRLKVRLAFRSNLRAIPRSLLSLALAAFGRTGAITDDTQMTFFTAEGLLGRITGMWQGVFCHTPTVVHHAYLRWLKTQGESPNLEAQIDLNWACGRRPYLLPSVWLVERETKFPTSSGIAIRAGRWAMRTWVRDTVEKSSGVDLHGQNEQACQFENQSFLP